MSGVKVRPESLVSLPPRKRSNPPLPISHQLQTGMCWMLCSLGRAAQLRPGESTSARGGEGEGAGILATLTWCQAVSSLKDIKDCWPSDC